MDEINIKRKTRLSLFIPILITFSMWLVKSIEWLFDLSFRTYGVRPRSVEETHHIFLSPFIHKDWEHLWANTIPFFVLSWALFFFYRKIATKTLILLYLFSGLTLWFIGRNAFHIGMSGIIYSLATFLSISGLIKKNYRLTALSFIVIFLYGSLFWGLFPILDDVSWEGHLSGAIVGLILAITFRKQGPQPPPIPEDDEENILPEEIWNPDYVPPKEDEPPFNTEDSQTN